MRTDRTCEGCQGKKMLVMPNVGPIRGFGLPAGPEQHQWFCPTCGWGTDDEESILY